MHGVQIIQRKQFALQFKDTHKLESLHCYQFPVVEQAMKTVRLKFIPTVVRVTEIYTYSCAGVLCIVGCGEGLKYEVIFILTSFIAALIPATQNTGPCLLH